MGDGGEASFVGLVAGEDGFLRVNVEGGAFAAGDGFEIAAFDEEILLAVGEGGEEHLGKGDEPPW